MVDGASWRMTTTWSYDIGRVQHQGITWIQNSSLLLTTLLYVSFVLPFLSAGRSRSPSTSPTGPVLNGAERAPRSALRRSTRRWPRPNHTPSSSFWKLRGFDSTIDMSNMQANAYYSTDLVQLGFPAKPTHQSNPAGWSDRGPATPLVHRERMIPNGTLTCRYFVGRVDVVSNQVQAINGTLRV